MSTAAQNRERPVFLVGMPRSGTKLLRNMLNEHGSIRFSAIETEFFPWWVEHWGEFGDLGVWEQFQRFCDECQNLPFLRDNANRGCRIDCREWYDSCAEFSPSGVFAGLMRSILKITGQKGEVIWGDKSPSYTRYVPMLHEHFPQARVIHLVRDVRDYCLSMNRAWGKSMLRAAQRWQDDVSKCCRDGTALGASIYLEVRYEDLLADPKGVLERVADFLSVQYDERMLHPDSGTENLGEAKGMRRVHASNANKYHVQMSPTLIEKIERITCSTLRELHYPCSYAGPPIRLSSWKMRVLKLIDGVALLRATARERGLIEAVRNRLGHLRVSPR